MLTRLAVFLLLLAADLSSIHSLPRGRSRAGGGTAFNTAEWEIEPYPSHRRTKRKAIADLKHLWPNGTIYFTVSEDVEKDRLAMSAIAEALEHWHIWTCIRFIHEERNATADLQNIKYVQFVRGVGCHSSVGRGDGVGPQNVSIGSGCAYAEMMIHELGHLIGMWHEHARSDRDNNVIILWNNVKPKMKHNFVKMPVMKLLAPYDLSSMMHYDLNTFSVNGEPTLKPVDERLHFLAGYRRDLSFYDIHTANQLYNCAGGCPDSSPVCENEGFLLEDCQCHCPRGLAGSHCQHIETFECGGILDLTKQDGNTSPDYPDTYKKRVITSHDYPDTYKKRVITSSDYPDTYKKRVITSPDYPDTDKKGGNTSPDYPDTYSKDGNTSPDYPGTYKKGVITSPGYPDTYKNALHCAWLIKSPPGTYMKVTVTDLDVERSRYGTCRDRLEIRYHHIGIEKGPIFCGKNMTDVISSTTNRIIVHFDTNDFITGRGFNMTIDVHEKSDCSSSPCQHNGSCSDMPEIRGYICECTEGWIGLNCDIALLNGGFSEWSDWSECKSVCGLRERNRTCTNPVPQNGGLLCQGPTYETERCGDHNLCQGMFLCDFGRSPKVDICSIVQEEENEFDWSVHHGQTPSLETGPLSGHTSGDSEDNYLYLEASGAMHKETAIFWLPTNGWKIGTYCLQFFYALHGKDVATLTLIRRWTINSVTYTTLWQRTGDHGPAWLSANVDVLLYKNVQIGFLGVIGDGFASDIALDDISISPGTCKKKKSSRKYSYGCWASDHRLAVGDFSYFDSCSRVNCFCNPDGRIDCPKWKNENICSSYFKKKPRRKPFSERE